jgi:hypothetical protein
MQNAFRPNEAIGRRAFFAGQGRPGSIEMQRRQTLEMACPQAVLGIYDLTSSPLLLPGRLCAACLPPGRHHKHRPCRRELALLSSVAPVFVLRYRDRA